MYKLCKTEESAARQKMLEDGLLQAMQSQLFDDISVSDLCKQLGVPRNTFYRYFPEKEDALLALIDHTLLECNKNDFAKWEGNSHLELSDLETFFLFWDTKRDFIEAIAKNDRFWLLIGRCNLMLNERKKSTHFTGDLTNFAKEQVDYIFTYGMMTILFRWYYYGFPGTPQEMARVAYEMFSSSGIVRTDLFL